MSFSKVQIISLACGLLGKFGVNVIGSDPLSAQADAVFDLLLAANMQKMSCRFGTTIVQLSLSDEVPVVQDWQYIYPLPGDYLKLIRLDPLIWDYEIYENANIYTNFGPSQPLYLEYVRAVSPEQLSPIFVQFLVAEIAMWLAAGSAQNAQLTSFFQQISDTYRAQASAIDSQSRPNTGMQSAPIIEGRMIGLSNGSSWTGRGL